MHSTRSSLFTFSELSVKTQTVSFLALFSFLKFTHNFPKYVALVGNFWWVKPCNISSCDFIQDLDSDLKQVGADLSWQQETSPARGQWCGYNWTFWRTWMFGLVELTDSDPIYALQKASWWFLAIFKSYSTKKKNGLQTDRPTDGRTNRRTDRRTDRRTRSLIEMRSRI